MSVQHHSLSVLKARVVKEGAAIETSLFAQSCDSLSVVVSQLVHLEDSLSYIWGTHEVNLEELSLKVSIFGSVYDQSF